MNRKRKTFIHIFFDSVGEYRLHYHAINHDNTLGPSKPFNCAIRDTGELQTECIELHLGEELHFTTETIEEEPLLRYDENGFWSWLKPQQTWWPLRNTVIKLGLDSQNSVRIKYVDQ